MGIRLRLSFKQIIQHFLPYSHGYPAPPIACHVARSSASVMALV